VIEEVLIDCTGHLQEQVYLAHRSDGALVVSTIHSGAPAHRDREIVRLSGPAARVRPPSIRRFLDA
jgi:hypothetical protein